MWLLPSPARARRACPLPGQGEGSGRDGEGKGKAPRLDFLRFLNTLLAGCEKCPMTDLATHLLISNDLKTLLRFAIRDEFSKLTLSLPPLYVDDLVEESELVERQTGAPLGARSRLAARVAASPIALSPNGCKGKKSRIARRGKPR